jgi:hypothetical protein
MGPEAVKLCYSVRPNLLDNALVEIDELQTTSLDSCPYCLDQPNACPQGMGIARRYSLLQQKS